MNKLNVRNWKRELARVCPLGVLALIKKLWWGLGFGGISKHLGLVPSYCWFLKFHTYCLFQKDFGGGIRIIQQILPQLVYISQALLYRSLQTRILKVDYPGNMSVQPYMVIGSSQQDVSNHTGLDEVQPGRCARSAWQGSSRELSSQVQMLCAPKTVVGFGKRYNSTGQDS